MDVFFNICPTRRYFKYIRRAENGKIAFARFAINENSDRKMENDIVFLKSIHQAIPASIL